MTKSESMSFVQRLFANPSYFFQTSFWYLNNTILFSELCSHQLYFTRKSSWESLTTFAMSTDKVAVFIPSEKGEGTLLHYGQRRQAEKWTEIGKYATEIKITKGSFLLECDHTICLQVDLFGLPPREFSFSRIKTTCLLVASPGRWGLNLNPGDSVIIELQCFGYLLFILKLLKRVSCSTESALRCPG